MAEKDIKTSSSDYDIGLGKILIFSIIFIFIVWILSGGPNKKQKNKNILINKESYPSVEKVPIYGRTKDNTTGEYNSWSVVKHKN